MKFKSKKHAFTIVELVIVIAVIAILAAILIPTFTNLIRKAQISSDQTLVKNLNTSLAAHEVEANGRATMYDTLEDLKESGFIVERLTPTSTGSDIVWDSKNNQFVLITKSDDGKVSYFTGTSKEISDENHRLWKIYDKMPENSEYSIYLSGTNLKDDIKVSGIGIDVGENTQIKNIEYTGLETSKQVVIRTNGGLLNINAEKDTINHYGWLDELNVIAVSTKDCYHEHGYVGKLTAFESGKMLAYSGARFHQTKSEVELILDGKNYDITKAEFITHRFNADGVCIIANCGAFDSHIHEHTWGEWQTTKEPTDTECGEKVRVCAVCNTEEKGEIAALGHIIIHHEAKAATCTEGGWNAYDTCSRCDHNTKVEIAALGHLTVNHDAKDATCTEGGWNAYETCERCDYNTKVGTEALGHLWGNWTSIDDEHHTGTCTRTDCEETEILDHEFVDGVCYCGKEEITEPVVVYLDGVVSYAQADNLTDAGDVIGTWMDLGDGEGISYYNNGMFCHVYTVTYTIPEGTPANATIICNPVNKFLEDLQALGFAAAPGEGYGFTYKIVDNSGNNFSISDARFNSDVVEAIKDARTLIKLDSDENWIVLKEDGTYYELDADFIPNITNGGYFKSYVTWLKGKGKTTYTSASATFVKEYYSTHSKTEGQRFIDYINELVASGTSMETIMASLCGSSTGSAVKNGNEYYRHVEGEVIKLMFEYSYEHALGFAFVKNTEDGWRTGAYQKIYQCYVNSTGFGDWSTYAPTNLNVTNFFDSLEGADLYYSKVGNVISGGFAVLWHAYAGNAWQDVALMEPPQLTITLSANS